MNFLKKICFDSPKVGGFAVSLAKPVVDRKRKYTTVLFHTGRCGSTVLGKMLGNHSEVRWGGEIFNKIRRISPSGFSNTRISQFIDLHRYSALSPIYGFEVKFLETQNLSGRFMQIDLPDFINLLKESGVTKFITLQRKNYLRRFISAEKGKLGDVWHSSHQAIKPVAIKVDLETPNIGSKRMSLQKQFELLDKSYFELESNLKAFCPLSLTYEEDIEQDPQIAYRKVCDFLSIPDQRPSITLRRTNPFLLTDLIENYDEVEHLLRNTKYEWMLEN